jgi:crossover junction endodeoxyribonuclease RuvC
VIIFGIDPGTATTGYGVIKYQRQELQLISYGLIETDKNGAPETRLASINKQLKKLLLKHDPDVMAIEKLFFATNAKTAMRVGQAQGVMLLSAAHAKIPVVEYAPGKIKKTVTGSGRANKDQVQKSVRKVLGAKVRKKKGEKTHFDNAADALAVALCHVMNKGGEKCDELKSG